MRFATSIRRNTFKSVVIISAAALVHGQVVEEAVAEKKKGGLGRTGISTSSDRSSTDPGQQGKPDSDPALVSTHMSALFGSSAQQIADLSQEYEQQQKILTDLLDAVKTRQDHALLSGKIAASGLNPKLLKAIDSFLNDIYAYDGEVSDEEENVEFPVLVDGALTALDEYYKKLMDPIYAQIQNQLTKAFKPADGITKFTTKRGDVVLYDQVKQDALRIAGSWRFTGDVVAYAQEVLIVDKQIARTISAAVDRQRARVTRNRRDGTMSKSPEKNWIELRIPVNVDLAKARTAMQAQSGSQVTQTEKTAYYLVLIETPPVRQPEQKQSPDTQREYILTLYPGSKVEVSEITKIE